MSKVIEVKIDRLDIKWAAFKIKIKPLHIVMCANAPKFRVNTN